MTITITLDTDNDAFATHGDFEVERILREIAGAVGVGHTAGKAIDSNGNSVGKWKVTP